MCILNSKTFSSIMSAGLFLSSLAGFNNAFAAQATEKENGESNKTTVNMVDGRNLVEKMHQKTSNLKSYSFKYKMKVFDTKKPVLENGSFYYNQPNLIRLEEEGPYKKGAVAVLTREGHVKAHLGGGLKLFVVQLSPDSKLLKSANGHPMIESDFKSLTGYLKKYIKSNMSVNASAQPIKTADFKEKVFLLEIHKSKNEKRIWKKIAVDPRTYLPLKWWDYNDRGKLHSVASWHQVTSYRQLPDELFTIKQAKSVKNQIFNYADGKNADKISKLSTNGS